MIKSVYIKIPTIHLLNVHVNYFYFQETVKAVPKNFTSKITLFNRSYKLYTHRYSMISPCYSVLHICIFKELCWYVNTCHCMVFFLKYCRENWNIHQMIKNYHSFFHFSYLGQGLMSARFSLLSDNRNPGMFVQHI